jgi:hypothetical protein
MAPDCSKYDPGQTILDYWTFEPTLAFAYLANNWAVSFNLFYDINTASQRKCCAGSVAEGPGSSFPVTPAARRSTLIGQRCIRSASGSSARSAMPSSRPPMTRGAATPLTPRLRHYRQPLRQGSSGAFGGLVGYNFGPMDIQVWVTDAVYPRNDINGFGVWNRLSFRLWAPEAPHPLVSKS